MKPKFRDIETLVYLGPDKLDSNDEDVDMFFGNVRGASCVVLSNKEGSIAMPISKIIDEENLEMFANSPFLRNMLIAEDLDLWNRKEIKEKENAY